MTPSRTLIIVIDTRYGGPLELVSEFLQVVCSLRCGTHGPPIMFHFKSPEASLSVFINLFSRGDKILLEQIDCDR